MGLLVPEPPFDDQFQMHPMGNCESGCEYSYEYRGVARELPGCDYSLQCIRQNQFQQHDHMIVVLVL